MFTDKFLKWLSTLATIVMLFVQLGGALVTKTGSADGCGSSWPLCNGSFIPSNWPIETIIELAHRGVSGLALILVCMLAYISWVKIGYIKEVKPLCITSIAFIFAQALIGAAAVIWQQNDFILSLHFGISLISFASVLLLTLIIYEIDQKFEAKSLIIDNHLKFHTYAVTTFIYIVIYSGALVRHADASLACLSWPLCQNGNAGLPQNFYEWVQMSHRSLAFIIFIWILYIFIYAFKNYAQYRVIKYGWTLAFILVCLQVTTGALSVITRVNLFIALLHALFITMLFGLLCYFIMLIVRSKRKN
ncbi:COX15/CtaA family protein [Mammaliicoccus vitulinus]|uniref:Heme A synthase n=1 Tax=Mammaliicoccus vitulinus TaxID=71237 RepID=A0ABX7HG15_9STAP|nr:heme A synthase [Mammaliicoccus vitulinus]PNZ39854.1 heme A synthase [Mammaliicoccus vitulinus]QRO85202.1 heme A synthase [Mammaliicoccus vitulinus]